MPKVLFSNEFSFSNSVFAPLQKSSIIYAWKHRPEFELFYLTRFTSSENLWQIIIFHRIQCCDFDFSTSFCLPMNGQLHKKLKTSTWTLCPKSTIVWVSAFFVIFLVEFRGHPKSSYFRSYLQRLMKLKFATTATKNDMIGQIETVSNMSTMSMFSVSSMFSRSSTATQLKQKETIFTLGNRNIVIESELEASPIVPHAERIQDQLHSFESLFR